jgi:hypothetical protein
VNDPQPTPQPTPRRLGEGSALSRWLFRDVVIPLGAGRRLSLTSVVIGVALVGSFVLRPGWESPVPTCFGYWLTAIPCPLCGITRAMVHLAHGRVADALYFHPAVFAVFPLLLMGWIEALLRDFGNVTMPPAWKRTTNVVGWATLLFIGTFGTVRAVGTMVADWVPW